MRGSETPMPVFIFAFTAPLPLPSCGSLPNSLSALRASRPNGGMADWIEPHAPGPHTVVERLDPDDFAPGFHRVGVHLVDDATARPLLAPALVARGAHPGPVVGITAAVHGNELNGIPTIHRLFRTFDPADLRGTVFGVTIANVPGYVRHDRLYPDGKDLNRVMPGRGDGDESAVYAARLRERVLDVFEVLIDLHTASFGRVNTLYVRADLRDPATARLARAIGAQILVHNAGADGTVRATAAGRGVPAITVEIGDPQVIDRAKVRTSRIGIRDALESLGVVTADAQQATPNAVECARSYWLYTDAGGLLEVTAPLGAKVEAGDRIATLVDPWGQLLRVYRAPEPGWVVGKSTNPVARTGSRILHLGIEGPPPG